MKIVVNGKEIDTEQITFNSGLNFGRFNEKSTKTYEISFSNLEFIGLIEKEYNDIRNEIELDDKAMNDQSVFSISKYCSLTELLPQKTHLKDIITTYLDQLLFAKIFSETNEKRYVINSTDDIIINNDNVTIKGRVFEID